MVVILFLIGLLTGCTHVQSYDFDPYTNCNMPLMLNTYEEPRRFHEGCTRHFHGEYGCAVKVEYIKKINHYNVTCRRMEIMREY